MKNLLRWAGAFLAVALISFGGGAGWQFSKASAAKEAERLCGVANAAAQKKAASDSALLYLYRARVELTRSNFGSAGDMLAKVKTLTTEAGANPEAVALVDKAAAATLGKDEAGAAEAIQGAIKLLE